MKLQKHLLAGTVKLMPLGGIVALLWHVEWPDSMRLWDVAIASPYNISDIIIQAKQNSNPSTNGRGGTGKQGFGAASARAGDPPPPAGGRQTSGGARGACFTAPPLTALAPSGNFGITTSSRPTFWFYLPEISEDRRGEIIGYFGLLNRNGAPIFESIELTLPDQAGYVGISVPENVTLNIGDDYQWYFEFNCEASEPATAVHGWIRRIELAPELVAQAGNSDQAAYDIYVNNLIWFDVIDYFTRRRLAAPNNQRLRQTWSDLLGAEGIDLEDLPSDPILFEYQPN